MTTNQILIGIGLILALAVGAQVLASRLHIPAIIVLLPAGFIAGALTTDVNPDKLLGPAFEPLVSWVSRLAHGLEVLERNWPAGCGVCAAVGAAIRRCLRPVMNARP